MSDQQQGASKPEPSGQSLQQQQQQQQWGSAGTDSSEALAQVESASALHVLPLDSHNARLLSQVHPRGHVNPEPAPVYNMVVVGAGAGGLVTAAQCAKRGARVAIIEANLMGGDCLNSGCVPSKALLSCAKHIKYVWQVVHDYGGATTALASTSAMKNRLTIIVTWLGV